MALNRDHLLSAIKGVLKDSAKEFHLHEPMFQGRERDYVLDCIDTGWVSTAGSYVGQFEKMIAEKSGTRFGVAVVNGTSALHISLKIAGVQPGDEVIIPALTFIATANAVSYCGAVPHFVDSDIATLGLYPQKLKSHLTDILGPGNINKSTGRRIAAIVPVHIFGHPVDMDALNDVAAAYDIPVAEDAAESLGSTYKDRKCGSLGRLAALSFNGNKIVTTGGGGAIVTDDEHLARRAKHLTTTARVPHDWAFDHDEVGYNYRMPNINAALGVAQLEKLDEFVTRKRNLAQEYREAFANIKGAKFFTEPEGSRSNYWLNAFLLDDSNLQTRDDTLAHLNAAGIFSRPVWTLMHRLEIYKHCPRGNLDTAEDIERRLINIPSSAKLGAINAA